MPLTSHNTAGLIVIGNEILNGQIQDVNTHYLCQKLWSLGIKVKRVAIIADNVNEIKKEVQSFSSRFDYVFTSGGIGPTYDDVTMEAVAAAFEDVLQPNPDLVEKIQKFYNTKNLSSTQLRLATVPSTCKLKYAKASKLVLPLYSVNNVFVLPGVPSLLQKLFRIFEENYNREKQLFYRKVLYLNISEMEFADKFNELSKKFEGKADLGSYPVFNNDQYKLRINIEADNEDIVEKVYKCVLESLEQHSIVNMDEKEDRKGGETSAKILNYKAFLNDVQSGTHPNSKKVKEVLVILESALDQYSINGTSIAFNGGKDCTVVLHIFYCLLKSRYPENLPKIKAFYVKSGEAFSEVDNFVKESIERYNLELTVTDLSMREALQEFKNKHPEVKATILGTRRTDPHSQNVTPFSMTDSGWPEFMRVCPLLNWSYAEIWQFLRHGVPYCSLYDHGYTSLGGISNTKPNPALKRTKQEIELLRINGILDDNASADCYLPAYYLDDEMLERAARS